MSETGYERMKRLTQEELDAHSCELKRLAVNYHNDPYYIAQEGFRKGLYAAVKEVDGWAALLVKAHEITPYANPKEAQREHDNTMNLLAVIKSKLETKVQIDLRKQGARDGE